MCIRDSWKGYYEKVVERVKEKNPDAVINLIEVGSFDHLDTIDKTDASNKDVADVFALPADRIYGLVQNDILAGIDSKKIAEAIGGWDDFDSGIGGNFKIKDEYFAFPYNIETLILFINKANAEAAGVDISKPMEVNDLGYDQALLPLFDAWFGVAATNSSKIDLLGKDGDKLNSDMKMCIRDRVIRSIPWSYHYLICLRLFLKDQSWKSLLLQLRTMHQICLLYTSRCV